MGISRPEQELRGGVRPWRRRRSEGCHRQEQGVILRSRRKMRAADIGAEGRSRG